MQRKYIKTFEQFINEEGTAPDEAGTDKKKEPKKEKPDYSDVAPTATKIMKALNKAGFEINQDDIVKWDGDDDDEGDLTVKIDGVDMYFSVEKGLLYYQLDTERVMLGSLDKTEDLVNAIKDYYDVKTPEEKKKEEAEAKKKGGSEGGGINVDDIAADMGDDSLGL